MKNKKGIKLEGLHPLTQAVVYYHYGLPSPGRAKIIMYNHLTDSHWFSFDAGLNWQEIDLSNDDLFSKALWFSKADIIFYPSKYVEIEMLCPDPINPEKNMVIGLSGYWTKDYEH